MHKRNCPKVVLCFALASVLCATAHSTFAVDPGTLTWEQLSIPKNLPPRAGFATAYDPISKMIVLFGGSSNGNVLAETWVFDGQGWSHLVTLVHPGARVQGSMAYDRITHKLVMFGGFSGSAVLNDTWLFDGATRTWSPADPAHIPPPASGAMLFPDPLVGHVDMFGGFGVRFYSRSTWRWTGSDWHELNPANSPYPRNYGVAVLDPVHHNVVVFGGLSDIWITGNTWTWDGHDWTEQFPTTQPPTLYHTTGGFDPQLNEVVVFGGGYGGNDQNTTWAWDGTDWNLLSPSAGPFPREEHGTVWDPARQQFVLFAGANVLGVTVKQYFGDSWMLRLN